MQSSSAESGLTLKIDRISLFDTRYSATDSARHSSIDEETVPKTELEVWPGLYQDVILPWVKGLITYKQYGMRKVHVGHSCSNSLSPYQS
jgi:hypothetical protein